MPENQPLTSSERGGDPVEEEIIHFSYKNHNFFWILTAILTVLKQKRQIHYCGKKLLFFFQVLFFSTTLHRQQIHKVVQRHFRRQKKLLLSMSLSLVKFLP